MRLVSRLLTGVLLLSSGMVLRATTASVESAGVYGTWGVWSDWFWPFNNTEPPNLYTDGEAMWRYDQVAGTNSQAWELAHHGPALNQPDWAGHCHAWSGASIWETMPTADRVVGGVTFRARDLAALMIEAYYNDTSGAEISLFRPSPGLLWRYLRQEIMGQNAMHGHAMAIIGNLTSYRGQVWNFPIYQYQVNYTIDDAGICSGTMTLTFADDGSPGYADSLGLAAAYRTYTFSGVSLDGSGAPLDSGNWAGNDPAQYPTSIWRPYYAGSWSKYLANGAMDGGHLAQILDLSNLGAALNANALKWTTGGDGNWYGQNAVTHSVGTAAQSGWIGNNQSCWFQTTVSGSGTIAFWEKISSQAGSDFLKFTIDGQEQPGGISGQVDWRQATYPVVGDGPHTLTWIYAKDGAGTAGYDSAWVAEVLWQPSQGAVSDLSINAGPLLSIGKTESQVVVSWPTNSTGYVLESCGSLGGNAGWAAVTPDPVIVGDSFFVTNAVEGDSRFYRLRKP